MCDCYTGKCVTCKCAISIHIADYCTDRDNVHPYCHRCTRKIIKPKNKGIIDKSATVFVDTISSKEQVCGGEYGERVVILCDDKKAYGIHLN